METQALVSGESSAPAGTHNPVRGFLEIATSDPIMSSRVRCVQLPDQFLPNYPLLYVTAATKARWAAHAYKALSVACQQQEMAWMSITCFKHALTGA